MPQHDISATFGRNKQFKPYAKHKLNWKIQTDTIFNKTKRRHGGQRLQLTTFLCHSSEYRDKDQDHRTTAINLPLQARSSIMGIALLHLLSSCEVKLIRYYEQLIQNTNAWIDYMKIST